MGVDIDPAGRDQQAAGVDFAPPGASLTSNRGDFAASDCDIAIKRRRSRAVNDFAIANDEIIHTVKSPLYRRLSHNKAALLVRYFREIRHSARGAA
jgi:hypothetical protein